MEGLKSYYNQNRKKIWSLVIIIIFFLALLYTFNEIAKSNNKNKIEQKEIQLTNTSNNEIGIGENKESTKANTQNGNKSSNHSIIEQFVTYCNERDLESAYNMLTDDCKNEMFTDIGIFEKIYYNSTFENKQKEISLENWSNNTYLVKFTESALATGKIADTKEEQRVDYITVEEVDDEYKLNINSFIGYTELGKSYEKDDVKIDVIGKHTYMNYETYTIKISNNSDRDDITLDTLYDAESIYLEDGNGIKYPSYSGELSSSMLKVSSKHAKQIDIKFFSSYIAGKKIKRIVFSDFWKANKKSSLEIAL